MVVPFEFSLVTRMRIFTKVPLGTNHKSFLVFDPAAHCFLVVRAPWRGYAEAGVPSVPALSFFPLSSLTQDPRMSDIDFHSVLLLMTAVLIFFLELAPDFPVRAALAPGSPFGPDWRESKNARASFCSRL